MTPAATQGPLAAPEETGSEAGAVDWPVVDATAGPLGLAVSGGSDSTALAVLFARYRPDRIGALLTVDHGLRRDARDDVAAVEALGARIGVPVVALRAPPGWTPAGNAQAAARALRYGLMREACATHGLAALVLGHTADDQAETLLLRLGRGSGLRGLAAMRPDVTIDGLRRLRPLLRCRREDLRAMIAREGMSWREDPTNTVETFRRVAVRSALPRLGALGITVDRLGAAAAQLARASDAIDAAVAAVLSRATVDRAGAATICAHALFGAPEEVRLRALSDLATTVGGRAYPPDLSAVERAADALARPRTAFTLARACLRREGGRIVAWREPRGLASLTLEGGQRVVYDGRVAVSLAEACAPVVIAPLGAERARALPAVARREAMASAPAVFCADRCVAAPLLGIRERNAAPPLVFMTLVRHTAPGVAPPRQSWQGRL